MDKITNRDIEILRDLAKKQRELSESPRNIELGKKWLKHNTCRGENPMVVIGFGTFADELIKPMMKCESEEARHIEWELLFGTFGALYFGDDKYVRDYFGVGMGAYIKPFNIDVKVEHAADGLGHHFVPSIVDLEKDFHKIGRSQIGIHTTKKDAENRINNLSEILGDALPVKLCGGGLYASLTMDIVHIMSMEDMFVSMYDYPDLFKQMMNGLADDYVEYFDLLEREGLLMPTAGSEGVGQETCCFTNELPDKIPEGKNLLTTDIWGYSDSQETVGVSAEMFEEFFFPAYKRVTERYGLLSYGCCEPVHTIYDKCLSKLRNLRKISISPWCDEHFMGERLAGKKIIYYRKPSPNFLGVGKVLDEDAVRKSIDTTLECAKGCKIEFNTRDVYTVNNDAEKVRRYVEIIREEIDKHYIGE